MLPPGANGTTILIGLSGKPAADRDGMLVKNIKHRNETGMNTEFIFFIDGLIIRSPVNWNADIRTRVSEITPRGNSVSFSLA
jgi:hypothetical protein